MNTWKQAARDGVLTGTLASLGSAAAMVATSSFEKMPPAAATNAVSHWIWGDRAFAQNSLSLRYTATGYVVHHLSATFWAVLYEKVFGRTKRSPAAVVRDAAISTAVACFVDYQLTPHRLRPGYEQRLSRTSLFGVYGGFALGLVAAALIRKEYLTVR